MRQSNCKEQMYEDGWAHQPKNNAVEKTMHLSILCR